MALLTDLISDGRSRLGGSGQFGASLLRVVGLSLTAVLCQSYFWSPETPWVLKSVVAAIGLVAALRPDGALLVLAGTVPFGRVVSTAMSQAGPARFTEAIVLAFLAGWFWHRLRHADDERPRPPGLVPEALFVAVVAASVLVEIGVLRYWKDYWWPYAGTLLTYVGRDYLSRSVDFRPWTPGVGGFVSLQSAAIILEGLGLMRAAQVLCTGNPAFVRRLLRMLVLAAVGTAILSAGMALEVASAEGRGVLSVLGADRIAAHTPKVNTAASSFVLFLPILIGIAVWAERSTSRPPSIRVCRWAATAAGAGLLLTALWMAGSRTAMIAGFTATVGVSAAVILGLARRPRAWLAGIAVLVVGGIVLAFFGFGVVLLTREENVADDLSHTLRTRAFLWQTAAEMVASHPVFGVGIGQFPPQVDFVTSGSEREVWNMKDRFDAHNQFLQMAAEVGLVGGTLFVGMFGVVLWRAGAAFRKSRDALPGGVLAGLLAFLVTCLAGQPLFVEVVAFPFWIVAGVALATDSQVSPSAPHGLQVGRPLRTRVFTWFVIAMAVSIPFRVWQAQDQVNYALVSYGFSRWRSPANDQPYRLVRDHGTFFTYPHARWLELPIRRDIRAGRKRLDVDISLDGRLARTQTLTGDEWQAVELAIPADAHRRFRRIDLDIRAPSGVAAQVRVAKPMILEDQAFKEGGTR